MAPPRVVVVCTALIALILEAESLAAQDASSPLAYEIGRLNDFAAQVSWRLVHNEGTRTWVCRGEGSAVFLGRNHFLTADHVIDQNPITNECAEFGTADPVIEFGSAQLQATVSKSTPWVDADGLTYRDGMDLALVEVDERMIPVDLRSLAPLVICDSDPPSSAHVWVATEYGVYAANTQTRTNDKFARIDLAGRHGYSGGGVFDPERHCLAGIVSNGGPNGTNYVPNEAVRRFVTTSLAISLSSTTVMPAPQRRESIGSSLSPAEPQAR